MLSRLKNWRRKRQIKKQLGKPSKLRRRLVWGFRLVLLLIVIDIVYIATIWPDWSEFAKSNAIKSNFIIDYEQRLKSNPKLPPLKWEPVPYRWMPEHLKRAVIVAEDSRFYEHGGFDMIAFSEAMDKNMELGKFKYGASTISQQTVKNLYFYGSKSILRKWHELVITIGMEFNVNKEHILRTYLNIAEFGEGIYGVEAASKHYFDTSVLGLSKQQAAELAATLPSPRKHNPHTRTRTFLKRVRRIKRWM